MPRKDDLRGIETRATADGREQYRPYVPHPDNRNRKVRGRWTYSFAEAKGWRAKQLSNKANGLAVIPSVRLPLVSEAADAFLTGAEAGVILSPRNRRRYAPGTMRGYRQAFRDWIDPALGDTRIGALRRSEVQRFVDGLAAIRSGGTTRNTFHALAALYAYLLPRHDELLGDPTVGVILPLPGAPRERYADPEEMQALLNALPADVETPYALAFMAGLRKGEIRALPAALVDLGAGWIDVAWALDPKEGFKGPKSYAGVRSVPIFEGLRPYLARALDALGGPIVEPTDDHPGTLLLPATRDDSKFGTRQLGTPYKRQCVAAWAAADLEPIGLHEGRHSFGTAATRAGYDIRTVAEWMGHAQASTTLNIYAKKRGRVVDVDLLAGRMNRYLESGDGGGVVDAGR